MKRALHIVLVLLAAAACQGPRVIPKDTLADIYTEMFLADQQVRELNIPRPQMDTMLLYEAIFEKYGYDTDDYQYTLQRNLRDPERFAKVFEAVAKRLEGEIASLDRAIERQSQAADKAAVSHPLLDSIMAPFAKEAVFVGLARVERDTSRYSAWFRLVAVQEDTLMVPVDSVEARARRDSLKAETPADTVDTVAKSPKAPKEKLLPERPALVPPRGREAVHPRVAREREIIATEEVVETVEEVHAE